MFELKKVRYKNIINIDYLKFEDNKIISLIGASGSGKTTVLKMLNKLITPDSGQIIYNKDDLKNIDSIKHRRNVMMLSQGSAIFPGSIRDNFNKALYFQEKEEVSDEELKRILNIVHLDKDLNTLASSLSGGEKQRLALARMILLNPDVYLLDEPTSALDEKTEDLIISSIVNYAKKENKTVIMVTHSMKIANTYSDDVIEINKGDIV